MLKALADNKKKGRRAMRSPVTVVASFLIVLIGGLLLAPRFIDFGRYFSDPLNQLADQLGVEIRHSGYYHVTLLPAPEVRLSQVRLSQLRLTKRPQGATPPLELAQYHAQSITLGLNIPDLLMGKMTIGAVEIAGTRITLSAQQLQNAFDREQETALPIIFSLRDSSIKIAFADHAIDLQNVSATARLTDQFKPLAIDGRFDYENQAMKLSYEASQRQGKRLPISLRLDGGSQLVFEFSGFMTESPAREVTGEFALSSRQALGPLMRSVGLDIPLSTARYLSINGLIYANEAGVQTDRLRVLGLGQALTLQAALTRGVDQQPDQLFLNISAERLDVSGLTLSDRIHPVSDIEMMRLLTLIAPLPEQIDAVINIDRILLKDEEIQNASLAVGFGDGRLRLNRVSAQLPYESSFLAAGELEMTDQGPHLIGNMALNIREFAKFATWLTPKTGEPYAFIRKIIERTEFQRAHFSADLNLASQRYAFTDVLAQMGDYEQAFDVVYTLGSKPHLELSIETPMLDLVEWGLVDRADVPSGEKLVTKLPWDQWLGDFIDAIPPSLEMPIRINLGALTAGAVRLEKLAFNGSVRDAQLHIDQLRIGNYEGGAFDVSGILAHDRRSAFGQLRVTSELAAASPLAERWRQMFRPVKFNATSQIRFDGQLVLTAPDDAAWPAVQAQGTLQVDEMLGDASVFWPSRDLGRLIKDTRLRARLTGSAGQAASLIGLKSDYPSDQTGLVLLNVSMTNNNVGNITAETHFGEDRITFKGSLREVGADRELSGNMALRLKASAVNDALPITEMIDASAQIVAGPTKTSFSALSLAIGGGQVSGEGVISYATKRPNLTASLRFQEVNMGSYLPDYEGAWSSQPVSWSILGDIDANLELVAQNLSFGRLRLDEAKGRVRLVDGVLEGRELTASALGGTVMVNVLAEGGALLPSVRFDGKFTDMSAGAIGFLLSGQNLAESSLSGGFSMRMRGGSADEFMQQLSGDMSIDGGLGKLVFINRLNLTPESTSDQLEIQDQASSTPFASALILLRAEAGKIDIAGGELVTSPGPSLTLHGGIDLYAQKYDLALALPREFGGQWTVHVGGAIHAPRAELRYQATSLSGAPPVNALSVR